MKWTIGLTLRCETKVEHQALDAIAWKHLNRPKVLENNLMPSGPGEG